MPARELSEADYVIYFNVVEFRRILNTSYPYGELFVIVKGSPEKLKPPRVVWRAKKMLFAEDAIGDLIKDLKAPSRRKLAQGRLQSLKLPSGLSV